MPLPALLTAQIDVHESGTTELLAAVANQQIKVYAIALVVADPVSFYFTNGTTPYSPAMSLLASGAVVLDPLDDQPRYTLSVNSAFKIITDGPAQISGTIWYQRYGVIP